MIIVLTKRRGSNYSNNVCGCVCVCVWGGGCSGTRGGGETCVWVFGYEGLKEIESLEDLGHRWEDNIKTHIKANNDRMICELEEEMWNKW